MGKKKSILSRIVAFLLIISLISPIYASTIESRASDYLTSYSAYTYNAAWYKVQVWVSVSGTQYMDEIGALTIMIYESTDNETWTWVQTFTDEDNPDMLGHNDYSHVAHVEYQGTIGRYYKAYVCVWAGKDGDGDNRYFWTAPVKATLFAG